MYRRKREALKLKHIDNPKIKFTLKIEGEWDFNRDLAGDDWNGDTSLLSYDVINNLTFRAAFQSYVANIIFSRCENCFDSVGVTDIEFDPQCEERFAELKAAQEEKNKKAKVKKLAKLEAETARLRASL